MRRQRYACSEHQSMTVQITRALFFNRRNRSGMYFLMHGWMFVSFCFRLNLNVCLKKKQKKHSTQHVLFKLKHCAWSGSVHS